MVSSEILTLDVANMTYECEQDARRLTNVNKMQGIVAFMVYYK